MLTRLDQGYTPLIDKPKKRRAAADSHDNAPVSGVSGLNGGPVMTEIYLLIAHGMDQGETYVLGWFDDKNKANEVAEQKEWETYYASLKAEHPWSSHKPLAPDKTEYRRYWVKTLLRLDQAPVPRSSAVH